MNANFKKYISIALVVCLLMALVSLVACKDKNKEEPTQSEPTAESTTPAQTTPSGSNTTTPAQTTPAQPTETVTLPSDEDDDPKQEDVFFD